MLLKGGCRSRYSEGAGAARPFSMSVAGPKLLCCGGAGDAPVELGVDLVELRVVGACNDVGTADYDLPRDPDLDDLPPSCPMLPDR